MSTADPIVTTQSLSKRYGNVLALDNVDLTLPRASIGLLGANGAGKSTLIKLLLGLIHPTAGQATMLGMNINTDAVKIRERVGYMPESDTLPTEVTAADFVGHMAEMSGLPGRAARQRANDVLYQVGVDEERYRFIGGFSTGMKQRVKLAQAIVHDPELVFLDEPTNGMDPQGRDDMLDLINRIHKQVGMTVIVSSHLLEDIERVCDYVVMVDRGKLVVDGKINDLMRGSGDVIVRVDGDQQLVLQALSRRMLNARIVENEVWVAAPESGPTDAIYDAIRDTVIELDMPLRLLRSRERSLEDVYIQTVAGEIAAYETSQHAD